MSTAVALLDSILVVEPLPRLRSGLEVTLQQGGYRVILDDGSDVRDKVENEVPDVVLLSCEVEGEVGDSFDLCRCCANDKIAAAIMMTHPRPTKEMVIKAARAGAKGFVVTPTGGPKFFQKLESVYSQTPQAESRAKFPIIKFGARNLTNAQKVDIIMRDVSSIRVMPHAVAKVLQVTGQDEAGAQDIARAAGSDPTLAAMILKRANSSYYGGGEAVTDIRSAVVRMGFKECRDLVLGMSVSGLFPKVEKSFGFNRVWYWVHSLACALLAEQIARRATFEHKQEAFTAGLLHDLGKIVLDDFLTYVYGQAVRLAHTTGITLLEAEEDKLQHNHATVGSKVAEKWRFPDSICGAIADHHNRDEILNTDRPTLTGAIYLADQISKAILVGGGGDFLVQEIPTAAWARYGCDDISLEALLDLVYEQLREFCSFMQINDKDIETALEHNRDSGTAVLYDAEDSNIMLLSIFLANQGFAVQHISNPREILDLPEAPSLFLLRPADAGEALVVLGDITARDEGPSPTVCILEQGTATQELEAGRRSWLRMVETPLDCFTLLCKARELLPDILKAKVIAQTAPESSWNPSAEAEDEGP